MKYSTYQISIVAGDSLKFFEVVACDREAAISDVRATYGDDVEIACVSIIGF